MKRFFVFCSAIVSAISIASALTWPEVSLEARPGTRWWWLGSAVDSVNLSWCINQYADAGIGSVEITPIYGVQGNDANEISYLSPLWMRRLQDVYDVSASRGVLVDMNQGTGWPFGGPEVSIDDAACEAIFLVDTVMSGALPVKVLPDKEAPYARLIAESRRPLASDADEVIRVYESRTRQAVKRAAPGGEGLVLDHFSRDAVSRYLDKFDRAFTAASIPYPHNFFNDSYEVYGANWTPLLFDEFEARRGYKLQEHLPELLGFVDDGNQVLSDYRETLGDLLLANFTEQWADWAHMRGIQVRNQAHGSPANLIDVYAAVDVPEIEGFGLSDFGIKGLRTDAGYTRPNYSDMSMLKYASSAAHITGKPLTSSETFTWLTEHFRTSLSQMKPDLDLMFSCGVNHVFFHGTAYSPEDDPWPGWKFYASIDMSPTNSIWRDAPALMQHITRCQSFLQSGAPDNDFLVYLPVRDMWHQRHAPGVKGLSMAFDIHKMGELAPGFISSIMQIDSLGYDCDYISDRYLLTTDVDDGCLVTAAGTRYKALIIPGSGNLPHDVKARLDSLQSLGAKVIYGIDNDAIKACAASERMRTDLGLRAIRRADTDGYHYFIANLTPEDVFMTVPVSVEFVDAIWFDPLNGDIYPAEVYNGYIEMRFRSGESRILRLYDHMVDRTGMRAASRPGVPMEVDLTDGNWTLSFVESVPEVKKTWRLKAIAPWTSLDNKELDVLMGTGVYTTTFNMTDDDLSHDWTIDLGDVRESARVYVNGRLVGTAWAVPFVLDISDALVSGKNELRIEVTNLPANRIADLDRNGVQWRKFKEINIVDLNYKKTDYAGWETMPAGLNSYVKLICR